MTRLQRRKQTEVLVSSLSPELDERVDLGVRKTRPAQLLLSIVVNPILTTKDDRTLGSVITAPTGIVPRV